MSQAFFAHFQNNYSVEACHSVLSTGCNLHATGRSAQYIVIRGGQNSPQSGRPRYLRTSTQKRICQGFTASTQRGAVQNCRSDNLRTPPQVEGHAVSNSENSSPASRQNKLRHQVPLENGGASQGPQKNNEQHLARCRGHVTRARAQAQGTKQ